MFPVERTPHHKKRQEVRRFVSELYEDLDEKKKQAEDRARYGEELRKQMEEQQLQRKKQKEALKRADEDYYRHVNKQNNQNDKNTSPSTSKGPGGEGRRGGGGGVGGGGIPSFPQQVSLIGQHNQNQNKWLSNNKKKQLDRLSEYPWQNPKGSGNSRSNNDLLHQQSMEWLRFPRGRYGGMSEGPLEGLKRLRRELMVEYQHLGGDAHGLVEQQQHQEKQFNVFSNRVGLGGGLGGVGRQPPLHRPSQQRFGYKPDQLDRWISDFQHKKLSHQHASRGAQRQYHREGGGGGGGGGGPHPKGTLRSSHLPLHQHHQHQQQQQQDHEASSVSRSLRSESQLIYL